MDEVRAGIGACGSHRATTGRSSSVAVGSIDLGRQPSIRWRADADKKGREWIVPLPEALVDELRTFKAKLAALGGWVFPGERKPD